MPSFGGNSYNPSVEVAPAAIGSSLPGTVEINLKTGQQVSVRDPSGIQILFINTSGSIVANGQVNTFQVSQRDGNGLRVGDSGHKVAFFGTTPILRPSLPGTPSGGTIIDVEARAAIDALRTNIFNLGLMG